MDSSLSNAKAYIFVGILSCVTTIIVGILNRKYSNRIKPQRSHQSGYSEWVAYLEREITAVKKENQEQARRIGVLERKLYERDTLIGKMRAKLLELSRKYNEDVSGVI